MPPAQRLCEVVHLVFTALWMGGLVMGGVAAGLTFPTLRGLDPLLPGYSQYGGEHWRLAAGHVAARIFLGLDVIRFVGLVGAGVTFGVGVLGLGVPLARAATLLRACLLVLLVTLEGYYFFLMAPEMNESLARYWAAAAAGHTSNADSHREVFERLHPWATLLLGCEAILVLALLVAGAWGMGPAAPGRDTSTPSEPLLVRGEV